MGDNALSAMEKTSDGFLNSLDTKYVNGLFPGRPCLPNRSMSAPIPV